MGQKLLPSFVLSLVLVLTQKAWAQSFYWDESPTGAHENFARCHEGQLSVLWWNTLYTGQLSRKLRDQMIAEGQTATSPLDENLKAMATSRSCLKMIALGEYIPGDLEPETEAVLRKRFPYVRFFPYNDSAVESGLAVFSEVPFDVTESELDWLPENGSDREREAYRDRWMKYDAAEVNKFTRKLIRLRMDWHGRKINIMPVHLLMPWEMIKAEYEPFGKIIAGWSLMYGTDNPLIHQIRSLTKQLREFTKEQVSSEDGFCLLGDFNLPDQLYRQVPIGMLNLISEMKPVFSSSIPTFPAASAPAISVYPRMMIDHAFIRGNIKAVEAQVLPLQGSDHYPLVLTLETPHKLAHPGVDG